MDQPRVPAGSPEGGQFASKFAAGSSGYEFGSRGYRGNKELTHASFDDEKILLQRTKQVFGKALGYKELAQVAGVPEGSRVTEVRLDWALNWEADKNKVLVSSDLLDSDGKIVGRQHRIINLKDKIITNQSQMIDPAAQGKGLATRGLVLQAKAASAAGFKFIMTKAAGSPGGDTNGYYTWPRLGFTPAYSDGTVGAAGKGGINLTKLMASPAGRKWWKAHGTAHSAKFDLTEGSISRRVLTAYAKAKGIEA